MVQSSQGAGPSPGFHSRGDTFLNIILDYAATGRPNMKWGDRAPLDPPLATALQGDHGISEKEGTEATVSLSFLNIHPCACNLSCWQSACD